MRFGMSGAFLPDDMNKLDEATCKRVRDLGFSGIFTRFRGNDPFQTSTEQCRRVRDLLEANGLRMYQCTGYWQCLIHPDESVRSKAARTLCEALRVAGDLGSYAIDTGPGSMNPSGPWNPHPDNWQPWAKENLIKSLRECAKAAEEYGVILGLEAHQLVVLETPEVTREVLEAVGSRWVRCDFDPVNWITLKTVFHTGDAVNHMVDVLGDWIASAHSKDIIIENRLTLHLDTVATGTGLMDHRTFLTRMEQLNPEYPVIVEAASSEQLPAVSDFLHRTAAEAGITVKS